MEDVFDDIAALRSWDDPHRLADDSHFATAVYRHAIAGGVMENVEFADAAAAD